MNILRLISFSIIIAITSVTSVTLAKSINVQSSLKDPGVINEERILYWLAKRGELKVDASEVEKQQALTKYLARAKDGGYQLPANLAKADAAMMARLIARRAKIKVQGIETKAGVNKTVKILVILVDFPDLLHNDNRLTANDTNMYYDTYAMEHYDRLVFSTTGYTGPSSQNLTTAYQYYQAESGGTLFLEGQVSDWVTATENSDFYGANDVDTEDDQDVKSLIKDAVTKAVATGNIDLADFDFEDQYDRDGDGNVNEPDGIIDHVMVFHSSVGEEAGGGVLGDDAIWSHRSFVDTSTWGFSIPDTEYTTGVEYKLLGYTIEPIDAAVGVVVHEFGHDLGVSDEYNTNSSETADRSPVGYWSLMASGSWTGLLSGSQPSGFSPLASNYFQQRFEGNWNATTIYSLSGLTAASETITIDEATNHSAATNLVQVKVPGQLVDFFPPYTGTYQYYSGDGHLKNNSMSFDLTIPAATTVEMTMNAHWAIEIDYDYARVLVDGDAIVGNHTKIDNQYHSTIHNFISDFSTKIAGAEGDEGWVDLTFDMSAYQGTTVTVTFEYVTDPAVGGYGFVVDNIKLIADSSTIYTDGAEDTPGPVTFDGFLKIKSTKPAITQNYWVQMRSHSSIDAGLQAEGYKRGMLVWFDDPTYTDNHVDVHPGHGFIGVVDAGQTIATNGLGTPYSATTQVKDAAFSFYDSAESSVFNDSDDYTTPEQPASGMVLPRHGLSFTIESQAADSSMASITFSVTEIPWRSEFTYAQDFRTVTFTNDSFGTGTATASWDFGDGVTSTDWNPVHTYTAEGEFVVTLIVTVDADGSSTSSNKTVTSAEALIASFQVTEDNGVVSVVASSSGGEGAYTYSWNFGDSSAVSTGISTTHTYTASGSYDITLTVTSADNQTFTTDPQTVTTYILPIAAYTFTTSNLLATFINSSIGGDGNLTYAWDFGDSETSTDASPSHTYASAGTYTVVLTITDGLTNTSTSSQSVTVADPPPPPPPPSSSGGGGGSMGIFLLGLLLLRHRITDWFKQNYHANLRIYFTH